MEVALQPKHYHCISVHEAVVIDIVMERATDMGRLSNLYPFLGPAFLVSVGFLEPSKWITMIDAGSCSGFQLVWLLFMHNIIAILCQSLAARVGIVTGKSLAQVCADEYPRAVCVLMWLQCEISLLMLDFAVSLGSAIILHLLLDAEIVFCIAVSVLFGVLIPAFLPLTGRQHVQLLSLSMVGLMFIFFILDALSSHQDVSVLIGGFFPRIERENLYTAASLLGANILPHNFYLHSSIIQEQSNARNIPIGTLCHYNFLEVAFAFSMILLRNLSSLNSASTVFHDAGLKVLTFQDMQVVVEELFRSSFASLVFFLALFCASQLSTLTRTFGGQVAMEGFLGTTRKSWLSRALIRASVTLSFFLCVWKSGGTDIYWYLIFSHVLLALQLPASVIPLFRVASSSSIMRAHRISHLVKVLSWLSFFWMVSFDFFLLLELFIGNSKWVISLKWNSDGRMSFTYLLVLAVTFMSIGLMLCFVTTPLRCEKQEIIEMLEKNSSTISFDHTDITALEDPIIEHVNSDKVDSTGEERAVSNESTTNDFLPVDDSNQNEESKVSFKNGEDKRLYIETKETAINSSETVSSKVMDTLSKKESCHPDLQTPSSSVSIEFSAEMIQTSSEAVGIDNLSKSTMPIKSDSDAGHDDDDADVWEHDDVPIDTSENLSAVTFDEPGSYRSTSGKIDEGGSGSGSLSRLSGLGRSARRTFAATLDDFWANFFDLHGRLTEQARLKRMDVVLCLKFTQDAINTTSEVSRRNESGFLTEQDKKALQTMQKRDPAGLVGSRIESCDSMSNTGASVIKHLYGQSQVSLNSPTGAYTYGRQPTSSLYGGERRYSSLHIPSYKEAFDYQPESSYDYHNAPYLERNAFHPQTASRIDSNTVPNQVKALPFMTNNSHTNEMLGSCFNKFEGVGSQNTVPEQSSLQGSQSSLYSYSPNRIRSYDHGHSIGQVKKYHSLPAKSYREMMLWDNLARQQQDHWHPLSQTATTEMEDMYSALGSTSSGTAFKHAPVCQADFYNDNTNIHGERLPLNFGKLSPLSLPGDGMSIQASSKGQNNSLWSIQPFDKLFGTPANKSSVISSERNMNLNTVRSSCEDTSCGNVEIEVLQSLRGCVAKLLRLEGSEWLFQNKGTFDEEHYGFDEELINLVAQREKILQDAELRNHEQDLKSSSFLHTYDTPGSVYPSVPHCGDGCVWGASLIVSFGVWCIHKILDLCRMESRPELWGKYTYVLNRLQGILEPAFSKPRILPLPCFCLQIPLWEEGRKLGSRDSALLHSSFSGSGSLSHHESALKSKRRATSACVFLEIIKSVESAVGSRKGRSGTAAGDVAFPKGKENLASVLKRYKRRLGSKPSGTLETNSTRRKV